MSSPGLNGLSLGLNIQAFFMLSSLCENVMGAVVTTGCYNLMTMGLNLEAHSYPKVAAPRSVFINVPVSNWEKHPDKGLYGVYCFIS